MLAQFQSKYPQGNLISELVQIYHGKYIVRASVQIDGATRATGMAAAEILEDAEDKARTRALMVLGITDLPQGAPVISPEPTKQVQPNVSSVTSNGLNETASSVVLNSPHTEAPATPPTSVVSAPVAANEAKQHAHSDRFATSYKPETNFETTTPDLGEVIPTIDKPEIPFSKTLNGKTQDSNSGFATTNHQEEQFDAALENFGIVSPNTTENNSFSGVPNNVTPFPSRSSNFQEEMNLQETANKRKKKAETVDNSDDIAKIGVEMQRLGWNTDQGRDYLVKTYGKRSRHLLSAEELKDFLKYLESQPTPIDPLAGF
ncbi:hypothetical protein F7734_49720 [Scytonema sp. UIC 10036]|uniref:hypothetical protein n=1 Tax=Scytonema sp. UIC 10036 TaxID=2304196 RepID=UPI0012DA03A1|nr:hypothetical protein [Scytonema sp. UIC 10036]MUG99932.1 hypothetical protein [Scytonema sp. UIC 10036]